MGEVKQKETEDNYAQWLVKVKHQLSSFKTEAKADLENEQKDSQRMGSYRSDSEDSKKKRKTRKENKSTKRESRASSSKTKATRKKEEENDDSSSESQE